MKKIYALKAIIPVLLLVGCSGNTANKNESKAEASGIDSSSKDATKTYSSIRIKARPDSITIDAASTAVIVVDMQNDFGSKGGMFDRAGIDISVIQKVVGPTSRTLAAARKAGIKIIYLKYGYQEDLSDFGSDEFSSRSRDRFHIGDAIDAPDGSKGRILVRGTWNTDILEELQPQPGDVVMYKSRFSGFYKTELDSLLKQSGIKYLIVTGCTTSVCVESTVRDARFRDYVSVVLEDCTAEPIGYSLPRSNHEASLLVIQTSLGWVSSSAEFMRSLELRP